MLKEFKEFALKGNVIDLAIGVIVGAAFQAIVKSLVDDVIMPLISLLFGNIDFSDWVLKIGNNTIKYGSFISAIVNFVLVAFTLFLVVRYINKLNAKIEEATKEAKKLEAKKIEELRKKNKLFGKLIKKSENDKEEVVEDVEATTKLCPYCLSEINIKAIRCPHCTSKLDEE